ncbi:MAG: type III-B CRISPR-associated protein Cas10/Cmr2 [Thermotogae bacterium]|nr:type III-B CRISPR-associated protein Cas10/Cmr2 [Thermotogota bacterium]
MNKMTQETAKRKIYALMHDPVEKVMDIINHEEIAAKRIGVLKVEKPSTDKSDMNSSTADRILLPREKEIYNKRHSVNFNRSPLYTHPLTGETLNTDEIKEYLRKNKDEINKKILNFLTKLKTTEKDDYVKIYEKLWWYLPKIIPYTYMIPADTRIPDHSIIDHLDTASAMNVVKTKKLSLIMFSIGPVQEFISAARKVRDLRSGSYLLSYLTFCGIKAVAKEYGWDNIVFPNLRDNYLVAKEIGITNAEIYNPEIASLPNVFTAIIPKEDEKIIREKIENEINSELDNISKYFKDKVNNYFENKKINVYENENTECKIILSAENPKYGIKSKEEFEEVWDNQIKSLLMFSGASQELSIDKIMEEYFEYTEENDAKDFIKKINEISEKANSYNVSDTTLYGFASEILGIKSFIRKQTRDFTQNIEKINTPGDDLSGGAKALITIERNEDGQKSSELLSAISFIKRYFHLYLKEKGYTEASKGILYVESIQDISKEYKSSIVMMDGDKMGEWISGKKAGSIYSRMIKPTKDFINKYPEYKEILEKTQIIKPAYQRTVSRTLNNFTRFVPEIINKEKGMLIYAGGDDVLAVMPANKAFIVADKIRKLYSGVLNEKISVKQEFITESGEPIIKNTEYEIKNGYAYHNGIPAFNLMGEKATMSAGIFVSNSNYNLKLALEQARKLEKIAKKESGRNSFAISSLRSGKQKILTDKWQYGAYDFLEKAETFYNSLKETDKKSIKSLVERIKYEIKNLKVEEEKEFTDYLLPFLLEKRIKIDKKHARELREDIFGKLIGNFDKNKTDKDKIEVIKKMLEIIDEYEFSQRKNDERSE